MTPRVLSLGGGLDSWIMLHEGVARGERIDVVVFVDVGAPGDPGEWPSTYRHIDEVIRPFCARHGIEFVVIDHESYPVSGPKRICTRIAKVERFEKWLDDRYPGQEVEVWIGFEAGEESRAAKDPNAGGERKPTHIRRLAPWWRWTACLAFALSTARRVNRFPLMEWGFCRCRCEARARASGYPVPRKSACVFCPYGTKGDWQRFAVDLPDEFERVAQLEERKPLTSNGRKLSIMAYDSKRQRGTPLRAFVAKPYTRQSKPCGVCGSSARATKATGCDYLPDPQPARIHA